MVEKHRFFGQNIADAIRTIRGGNRKLKSEDRLSPVEKVPFEQHCQQLVEGKIFGKDEFGSFCRNMIVLVGEKGFGKFARMEDVEEKITVSFNEDSMRILTYEEQEGHYDQDHYINYRPQKVVSSTFHGRQIPIDFRATVESTVYVSIPDSVQFFSILERKQVPVFPKGKHILQETKELSDKDVQEICKWTYSVYDKLKTGSVVSQ